MKRILIIAALIAGFTITSQANTGCHNDWKEKMMSEKIAFLTIEMNITPEEAQVFWPVYNQIAKTKSESHKTVAAAYKVLKEALDNENASDEQVNRLLDEYSRKTH